VSGQSPEPGSTRRPIQSSMKLRMSVASLSRKKRGVPVFIFEIRVNLRFNLGETSSSRLQPHPSRCRAAPLESHQEVEMKKQIPSFTSARPANM
jgi:hypothetical protein